MALRIVGAGLPRTGTSSLKVALERLLGGPCYHMWEVFEHVDEHMPTWRAASEGKRIQWRETFLDDYVAAVDWPASNCWRALAATYPDALILLSHRSSPEAWWKSVDATVFANARRARDASHADSPPPHMAQLAQFGNLMGRTLEQFSPRWFEHDGAIEGYERHLETVRAEVPASRLIEWQPGDGWQPLCTALGLPVPDEEFPHENSRDDFIAMNRARFSEE